MRLAWAIEEGIEFFVFDLFRLQNALKLASEIERPAAVHLEVESGMNRTGLSSKELKAALQLMLKES